MWKKADEPNSRSVVHFTWSSVEESHRLNSTVWKLLLLIYKGGVYWWSKNSHRKITMTQIQTKCPNSITFYAGQYKAYSAKIGALAQVLKKSVTEPPKNLLWGENTAQLFDVGTMNIIKQLPELTESAAEKNIDIICVQEHKYY